jgi:uncharacterized protein (TIGR02001 family)
VTLVFKFASLIAAVAVSFAAFTAPVAQAEETTSVATSANVGLFSEYRFRGVSLTDGDAAIQGGFDVDFGNGFSAGVWASNIETFNGSEIELDPYGFYSFEAGQGSLDVGFILYTYPGADDSHFIELNASTTQPVGGAEVTVGVAYAPEQDNIGTDDNTYLYAEAEASIPDTPFTVNFGVGYEDGAFADAKLDWNAGVSADWNGLTFGATYVEANADTDQADATIVFSISKSF